MAKGRNHLYRLRYVQVPFIVVLTAMLMIVAVFSLINTRLDSGISQLRGLVEDASYLTSMKQKEVQELALKLEMTGTDDFIANEARTQYGYLAPGEIRFIVTNKEALWGEPGSSPAQP